MVKKNAFLQVNLEQAENLVKRHEAFLTTMEANDDKINGVVQFAGRLCDEGHFAGMFMTMFVYYRIINQHSNWEGIN